MTRAWFRDRLIRGLRRYLRPTAEPSGTVVGAAISTGHVDTVRLHDDRVLALAGWAADLEAFQTSLSLRLGGAVLRPAHAFRVWRPDVSPGSVDRSGFMGAVVEWIIPVSGGDASIAADGRRLVVVNIPAGPPPPYALLRDGVDVWHREQVYGSGPPVHEVLHESLELALTLPEPVLDFGCGGGALVRALRARGREAYGLELDDPRIRERLLPEVLPFVTLYDGAGPAPFPTGRFASVACCEVLEHMPDPVRALGELARLAREALLVTVPDMSAIPRGAPHGLVPWHLLESTHVNFFTQEALVALLAPGARRVDVARVGAVRCGPLSFYTSLAARVTLPPRGTLGATP